MIADSVEVKTRAFASLFSRFGPEVETKVIEHHRSHGGMTRMEKLKHYYREFIGKEASQKELEDLADEFSSLVVDDVIASDPIDGINLFLETWYQKVMCFIDSATPDDEIVEIVKRRGLAAYFKDVLGSSRSKTENLELIMKKNNLKAEECLFFGDAYSDFRAAENCRVRFIGILPDENAPLLKKAPEIIWHTNFVGLLRDKSLLNI